MTTPDHSREQPGARAPRTGPAAAVKSFSIAELAAELGLTLRAIRFYEAKGLIAPRRVGLWRHYSLRDRARLILIQRGKRMGFSLRDIREFLDLYEADPTQVAQMRNLLGKTRERIARLEAQLQDVQTSLAELRAVERATRDMLGANGAKVS
ncbi:MerR family DNA-binding transcriptional regulator [Rhodoblastus sp.]|uniref:MerR family transcriptional regulator n=1 Tax=Rhodoblastus sp. TaxID=1962975 RepID=UPI002604A70C|nr:MerR family DNA-binding transcriptional regulator [Rhodoblastus sp.]